MEVPAWICSTICAGIDLDGLNDGSTVEDPDEIIYPSKRNENLTNPLMQDEEGIHLNTNRYGKDLSIKSNEINMASSGPTSEAVFKNVVGQYECGNSSPDINMCLEHGAEISHWISERILNPSSFCQYESGTCINLEQAE